MPTGPKKKRPPESVLPVPMAAPAEPETPHQYVSYEEAFPRDQGPPPLRNYEGKKVLKPQGEPITVELDPGAFRALWELVEATAKSRWEVRNSLSAAGAYVRAVEAFRKAGRPQLDAAAAAGTAPGAPAAADRARGRIRRPGRPSA